MVQDILRSFITVSITFLISLLLRTYRIHIVVESAIVMMMSVIVNLFIFLVIKTVSVHISGVKMNQQNQRRFDTEGAGSFQLPLRRLQSDESDASIDELRDADYSAICSVIQKETDFDCYGIGDDVIEGFVGSFPLPLCRLKSNDEQPGDIGDEQPGDITEGFVDGQPDVIEGGQPGDNGDGQ